MRNDEAFARGKYWNAVRTKQIEKCKHKAEDGSLICKDCWENFIKGI